MVRSFVFLSRTCCCAFFFFQAEDGIRDKLVTGVQTCALPISLERLQRDLGGQRRRPDQLEEASGPRARSVVLGEVAARLAHQPHRGVLRRLAKQRPQQRVVLQTSFPMYVHSPSVTGVIESRFPGRSSTIFASGLCVRSSARGTRRVFFSARTSTWNQRGSSFFALGS